MEQIVVGMAGCRVADTPGQILTTYALGSCIGLAVHDAKAGVGGLLHFMLPDSALDPARGHDNPYTFADTGIPRLLEQLYARGASKRGLTVHAVGAAEIMHGGRLFEIGKRNYLAMRRALWKAGLFLQGEAVGGVLSRTMRLEIGTGRIWLVEAGTSREMAFSLPGQGGKEWVIVS